jgi:rSAM/selenodomain-associated transferase 2
MKVSVIIPALNEAPGIRDTLAAVHEQEGPVEVIVADSGSADATRALAEVVTAPRGRAVQMNRGAAHATGEVLLFLHADTLLPPRGLAAIRSALADPAAEAGTFRLRFDRETPLLRFYSFCTRLEHPLICFGDRGLFVRRAAFDDAGGFPEVPVFEDLELVRRLHARGGFRFLPDHVTTSARRFRSHGPLRQQLRNTLLWTGYVLGIDPVRLARFYAYPGSRTMPL